MRSYLLLGSRTLMQRRLSDTLSKQRVRVREPERVLPERCDQACM